MKIDPYLVSKSIPQQAAEEQDKTALFKSLLQPHFLFNSLNNLYALSVRQSDQTSDAIAGLSHLLERVVSLSRREMVGLEEEIQLIRDYISLEKIWLGDQSFRLDLQVKGEPSGIAIPPLTLYTLIENAFKHGVRRCGSDAWITIHLLIKDDKILVKIRNSFRALALDEQQGGGGLGIEAVRNLLEGSYHQAYYLEARPIGNVFAVDLIIGRSAA